MKKILFCFKVFICDFFRKIFSIIAEKESCEICGKLCDFEKPVCSCCEESFMKVPALDGGFCKICGKLLISEGDFCMECRNEKILKSTDGVFPLFSYLLWNKRLLLRWKLKNERFFSGVFAKLIYERVLQVESFYGKLVLVPVPPRKGKIREKGWDQVRELCNFLKYKYDCSVIDLIERKSFIQQKTLDRTQRLESINKSYVLKKNVKNIPEKVCIIDDVITTGATIESCASILKNAGVKKVFAISLFNVS